MGAIWFQGESESLPGLILEVVFSPYIFLFAHLPVIWILMQFFFFSFSTCTTASLQSYLLLRSPDCTAASLIYSLRSQHSPFWRTYSASFLTLSLPYSHQSKMLCYENVGILFQTTHPSLYKRPFPMSFYHQPDSEPVGLQLLRELLIITSPRLWAQRLVCRISHVYYYFSNVSCVCNMICSMYTACIK